MKDRLQFLYLIDRLAECRDTKVFAVSHAGLGGDFFNRLPLAIGHPKGLFSVSFATLFGQSLSPLFFCKSGFGLPPEKNNAFVLQVFNGYAVENGSPNALLALSEWRATTAGKHLATVGKGYRTDGQIVPVPFP